MIGRRAAIGLSLLSALVVCAFIAQAASAAKATNTTAFTCVKGGGAKDFADAHCDKNVGEGKGEYGHVAIPLGEKTEGETTNKSVTEETKKSEPAVLKSKVAGAKVTIECANVKGKGSGVQEEPTIGVHTGKGEGSTEFTTCTVKELAKCVVAEPIIALVTGEALEKLGPGENEMGGEARGAGAEETITEIEFKNKGEEKCAINAQRFKIKGSATVTSGPTTESSQTGKSTGATAVYTPKNGMQKLKLGPEVAEFSLITTVTANGIPLSGTTVT
jgi:hypothetical protein